jgi:hypothetical protein
VGRQVSLEPSVHSDEYRHVAVRLDLRDDAAVVQAFVVSDA